MFTRFMDMFIRMQSKSDCWKEIQVEWKKNHLTHIACPRCSKQSLTVAQH